MQTSRMSRRNGLLAGAVLIAVALAAGYHLPSAKAQTPGNDALLLEPDELSQHTHIHGLAVDRADPSRLLVATHHGLFRTRPDGKLERISQVMDFMGFSPHPKDPAILYASGHPQGGGNLGFVASRDGGRTWTQISPGANGPVDFHQMTVSAADPSRVYGVYRGLQVSRDGGKSWKVEGASPENIIALAASTRNPDIVYAATKNGLHASTDAGATWRPLLKGNPVSTAHVTHQGALYAYVISRGLVRGVELPVGFQTVSEAFGEDFVLHLTSDPTNPERLFAATRQGKLLASSDGGRSWAPFGSS